MNAAPLDPRRFDAWLFDLDGTLVDSAPDLHRALDHALARAGLPPVDEALVRRSVGQGARSLLAAGIAHHRPERPAAAGELDALLPVFLAHYEAHIADHSRLYPGVLPCLDALAERGVALACVTNKYAHLADGVLKALGVRDRFGAVIGGDTLPVRKPDPAPLREACRRLGRPETGALMVGDSGTDVRAARAAGVPVVCVTYGYDQGEDVRTLGADLLVDSLDSLLA